MDKFTPGPWVVFAADADGANDVLPAMRPGHIAIDIASGADARLIAAAPDLLAALKAIMSDEFGSSNMQNDHVAAAQAAIARAEAK